MVALLLSAVALLCLWLIIRRCKCIMRSFVTKRLLKLHDSWIVSVNNIRSL